MTKKQRKTRGKPVSRRSKAGRKSLPVVPDGVPPSPDLALVAGPRSLAELAEEWSVTADEVAVLCSEMNIASAAKGWISAEGAELVRARLAERGRTNPNFLLRLPPRLRTELEALKLTSEAKSLQALLLQLIAEGLDRRGEFKAADLFGKDLHVRTINAAVGEALPDFLFEKDNQTYSIRVKNVADQRESIDIPALLVTHQHVVRELESQKLTGFASLMDPALMALRILLQATSATSTQIDGDALGRDFSNGLMSSAEYAIRLGRWGLAETLLIRACQVDARNHELATETAIFLLRRLLRRWYRPTELLTPGVTNRVVLHGDYERRAESNDEPRDDTKDETSHSTATRVAELFEREISLVIREMNQKMLGSLPEETVLATARYVPPKVQCWYYFCQAVLGLTSTAEDAPRAFVEIEAKFVENVVACLNVWERSFRMTREISSLQREWRDWFEALEIFWWLGYRNEAFTIATGVRGFAADKVTTDRFNRIREWDPQHEYTFTLNPEDPNPQVHTVIDRAGAGDGADADAAAGDAMKVVL